MKGIGVIIPAYNAVATLDAALESIAVQTLPVSEVIIVDDGSTDGTAEVHTPAGTPLRILRQKNSGQGAARQLGLEAANSEYLLFLDADDLLRPDALENLVERLDNYPGAILAYGRAIAVEEAMAWPKESRNDLLDAEGEVWEKLIVRNIIKTPGCAMIRRKDLLAVGGWDVSRSYQGNEDWDLWLRLAEVGPFARVEDTLLQYRCGRESYSANRLKMQASQLAVYDKHASRAASNHDKLKVIRRCQKNSMLYFASELWESALKSAKQGKLGGAFAFAGKASSQALWAISGRDGRIGLRRGNDKKARTGFAAADRS